jgi:hypothetical protein
VARSSAVRRYLADDDYVRPPLVAAEPRSRRAAIWRFRLAILVLVLAVATGLVLLLLHLTGGGEGSPGVLGHGHGIVTAATVPPPGR